MESSIGQLTSFAASAECITKSLEEDSTEDVILRNVSCVSDVLHSPWIKSFSNYKEDALNCHETFQFKFFSKQLEEVIIGLWNATVARQCAKALNNRTAAVLRQLCYDLLTCPLCSLNETNPNKDIKQKPYFHRRIMMATKAGKNWLDVGECNKAEEVLLKAKCDVKSVISLLTSSEENEKTVSTACAEMTTLHKHEVAILCYVAEAAIRLKDEEKSYECLHQASCLKFLQESDEGEYYTEKKRILVTSYNSGLRAANEHRSEHATKWLTFSFEFGKQMKPVDGKLMAQILRLLAHVYCETGIEENIPKSLCAVELANSYVSHPAGLHLRLKILAKDASTPDTEVKSVLGELLHHAELNIDLGLTACRYLNNTGRYDSCEWGLKELLSRFTGSRHVGRVHAERLLAAVQRLPMKDAVDFTDKFLDDVEVISTFDDDVRKGMQLLLWEQAAKCHEAGTTGDSQTCLSWYDQSLRLFLYGRSIDDIKEDKETAENVAKLHRNRAGCMLSLGRLTEAKDAAEQALGFDRDSLLCQFTSFKVAIACGEQAEAIKAVSQLMSRPEKHELKQRDGETLDTRHALICLAAQHSLEKGQREVAMSTLHHLATSGKHDLAKLTAYRCLVRLYLSVCDGIEDESCKGDALKTSKEEEEKPMEESDPSLRLPKDRSSLMNAAIQRVKDAFQVLSHLKENIKISRDTILSDSNVLVLPGTEHKSIDTEQFRNEVTWFMKITWNMALQFNTDPTKMRELFHLCKELLDLVESDQSVLLRQKTCLLMCAACGLTIARNVDHKQQRSSLEDVVCILNQCRSICNKLAEFNDVVSPRKVDKSAMLLALYHFEALAKLTKCTHKGEPKELEDLFNQIQNIQQADAKTFETVAALSMEVPAHHPKICKTALRLSLKYLNRQLAQDNTDSDKAALSKRISALYRTLIETCLDEGIPSDPTNKDECWTYFNEVYQVGLNDSILFPEVDKLWFSVRCWNVGVRLFTAGHVIDAEKWCALSLRLLSQLVRFKDSYENHMNMVYQEILAKKDVTKSRMME